MRRLHLAALAIACLLSTLWLAPATAAETGTFVIRCDPSHQAQVDPIVNPGPSGTPSGHRHQFFGARDTDSDSTLESMRAGGTTCRHPGDTAGYWMPSIDGVTPRFSFAYYKIEPGDQPFPPGLKMIAGGVGHPESGMKWDCFNGGGSYPAPPTCAANDFVVSRLSFPSCWDGIRLDSADHRSHVAYPTRGVCPSTHPVQLPRINFFQRWCLGACLAGKQLSDGTTTVHADFWNTWDQAALVDLINRCRSRNCGQVTS